MFSQFVQRVTNTLLQRLHDFLPQLLCETVFFAGIGPRHAVAFDRFAGQVLPVVLLPLMCGLEFLTQLFTLLVILFHIGIQTICFPLH